jgi:hypothetical protein
MDLNEVYPINRDNDEDVWALNTRASNYMIGRREALASLEDFFIFNTFLKQNPNLTLFFSKITPLAAPIYMARQINTAAPCMVARQG